MDILTLLENKIEAEFDLATLRIADNRFVQDWADYQHRAGYINGLRKVGEMIAEIRKPETAHDGEGGIASVLDETETGKEEELVA